MATTDYKVFCSGTKPREFTVRATSLLAAGWEFTRNPPPGVVVGPDTVQFTARAGHPWFAWEGRIKQGDTIMYCRIGYDVGGVRHSQDIAVRASNEEFARAHCGLKPSEIKSFRAEYYPFPSEAMRSMPRDSEIHGDGDGLDWDSYGM